MTSYNEIFSKIKPFLDIKIDQSCVDLDFIRGLSTLRIVTRYGRIKYAVFHKVSDDIILDSVMLDWIVKMAAKPIFRINQKRVAHGLESWFPQEIT